MEEIKKRLGELEKAEKAVQKSASKVPASVDSETTEATAEKLQEVDTLSGQLANVEAMLDKELGGVTEGISEVPAKTLEEIESELARLEGEIAKEEEVKVQTTSDKLKEIYPWIAENRSEFMYAIPPNPNSKDFSSWQEEWSRVLFDYARLTILHVLYMKKLMGEPPFADFRDRDHAIELIANFLVEKKLAKWITKSREELRVYWKSMEELAGEVDKWARDNAVLDPMLIQEFKDADQVFSTIPDEEWDEIFKILKKQKKISLIKLDSGQQAIKFLF